MNWRQRAKDRRSEDKGDRARDVLVRVVAPHFVAGLVIDRGTGRCVEAPPILAASIGKTALELRTYFDRRGWHAERVKPHGS